MTIFRIPSDMSNEFLYIVVSDYCPSMLDSQFMGIIEFCFFNHRFHH